MKENFSRRDFLIYSSLGLMTLSCKRNDSHQIVHHIEETPSPLELPEINLDLIQTRVKVVSQNYADNFQINLNPEKVAQETDLITNIDEYHAINNVFGKYTRSGEEATRPFFKVDLRSESTKRIFINGLSISETLIKRPTSTPEVQMDIVDAFLSLALADYLSDEYYSKDFNQAVFGEYLHIMGPKLDSLGKDVYVDGATLKYTHQERKISMFESLERLEQIIIADYIYHSSHPSTKIDFFEFGNGGAKTQLAILKDLFKKIYSEDESYELANKLFMIRQTKGARENLFKMAQRSSGRRDSEINIFGIAIFGAIASGDRDRFESLFEDRSN